MALIDPLLAKNENFQIELESKLDHHFHVKFDGESDGDGLES